MGDLWKQVGKRSFGRAATPESRPLLSPRLKSLSIKPLAFGNPEIISGSVIMSSGSTNLDPKYTSFFPNGLADGRRSNESPVPQEQRSGDNMNANKAASS